MTDSLTALPVPETGRERRQRPRLPSVSVLVPAWNEEQRIGRCLDSLLNISWPNLEVLVSAGGSDETLALAMQRSGERVRVVKQEPGEGKQRALRRLLAESTGEVLYLTDGDCVVSRAAFEAVLDPIVRGEAEIVTGTYCPYAEDLANPLVFYRWSIDRAVTRCRGPHSEGLAGANTALTRSALEAVRAFDDEVPTGTDYHLARRLRAAGFEIRFVDAAVETEYACDPITFMRRRSRWIRNTFLHGRRFEDRDAVRGSMRTMLAGTGILALPFISIATRRWQGLLAWLAVLTLLMYKRVQYLRALSTEIKYPLPPQVLSRLPVYTILDLASWVAPLIDLSSGRRRWRW